MQDETGGYCPMCDTVWALPGKCKCVNISDPDFFKVSSKLEIWNASIEAAAKFMDDKAQSKHTMEATIYHKQLAEQIRKLKK